MPYGRLSRNETSTGRAAVSDAPLSHAAALFGDRTTVEQVQVCFVRYARVKLACRRTG